MKNRLLILSAIITIALVTLACGTNWSMAQGSGKLVTEQRSVSNFNAIAFSGIGDLTIIQGESESLIVEAEDNIIEYITTEVKGQTLEIGFDSRRWNDWVKPTQPIKFTLTVTDLKEINLSGAGSIQTDKLITPTLEIISSGAGSIALLGLETESLTVHSSGAGSIEVSGNTLTQKITISGLGNYDAGDLSSVQTAITVSGAGNSNLWVAETLDITISGVGSVRYYGDPKISQSISGIGSVQKLDDK